MVFAPHLSWRHEPLRGRAPAAHPPPIFVDNDANAAAWAEWRFGAAQGESHVLMVTLGTGIGGALLMDGEVLRGRFGIAGEFGHMQVVPGGQRCECGNRGCWEQYASGNALVREARSLMSANSPMASDLLEHVGGDPANLTGPLITEAARAGDQTAIELLAEIGQWLGVGIANLAAAFDPGIFVIGGGVSAAGDLLLEPARERFRKHADRARLSPRGRDRRRPAGQRGGPHRCGRPRAGGGARGGGRDRPGGRAGSRRVSSIRVASYNLRDFKDDPAAAARVIRAIDPDVLCLQEVPRRLLSSFRVAGFARRCGMYWSGRHRGSGGTTIFTSLRVDVAESRHHRLRVARLQRTRGYAVIRVAPPGHEPLVAASVHLSLDAAERERHAGEILRTVSRRRPAHPCGRPQRG